MITDIEKIFLSLAVSLIVIAIILTAFFIFQEDPEMYKEPEAQLFNEMCIDGVLYIVFKQNITNKGFGYMSVKFNRDSKVVACD